MNPATPPPARAFPRPAPLPPPDADPVAQAEERSIAERLDRWAADAQAGPLDVGGIFRPEGAGLTPEEVLDPRVLARCRPETVVAIWNADVLHNAPRGQFLSGWGRLSERLARTRTSCPPWIRVLLREPPVRASVRSLVRASMAGDPRCRLHVSWRWKLFGNMPKELREDVRADAPGRFAIHAAIVRFRWSRGAVAALADEGVGPRLFAYLLRDAAFARAFPPEKLLGVLFGYTLRWPDAETAAARLAQLEEMHPGAVRAFERKYGGGYLLRSADFLDETLDRPGEDSPPPVGPIRAVLLRAGADPAAPDIDGIPFAFAAAVFAWARGRTGKRPDPEVPLLDGVPPPPPEPPAAPPGALPPPPPCFFHPLDRAVLWDGRPAAVAAAARPHLDDPGWFRFSAFGAMVHDPRVLRELGPETARRLLLKPLWRNRNVATGHSRRRVAGILRRRAENAEAWAGRFSADPADRAFAALFSWIVSRIEPRSFPTGAAPGARGRRYPAQDGAEPRSPRARLRRALAWAAPDEAAARVEALEAGHPGLVAKDELLSPAGSGPLWCVLLPRLPWFFVPEPTPEEAAAFDPPVPEDREAVSRLLSLLARFGAAPDLPAPAGYTPRRVAAFLGLPPPFAETVPF